MLLGSQEIPIHSLRLPWDRSSLVWTRKKVIGQADADRAGRKTSVRAKLLADP